MASGGRAFSIAITAISSRCEPEAGRGVDAQPTAWGRHAWMLSRCGRHCPTTRSSWQAGKEDGALSRLNHFDPRLKQRGRIVARICTPVNLNPRLVATGEPTMAAHLAAG